MVKLVKNKKPKGFAVLEINKAQGLYKQGKINIVEAFGAYDASVDLEAFKVLMVLYAISDKNNKVVLNDELQLMAVSLFDCLIDGNGLIDIDHFKEGFEFYKGLLDSIFEFRKTERRKAKKFGEPPYPSMQEVLKTMKELEDKKILNPNGSLNISKYDIAVLKQQLKEKGYKIE